MSLLDKMRKQFTTPAQSDDTQRVARLQEGMVGREVGPSSAPGQSTLAERIAQGQTRQQVEQAKQKAEIVGQQQATAEEAQLQQFRDEDLSTVERAMDIKQSIAQKTDALLNGLKRQERALDFQKDAARLEQIGFDLRMNNKKYIDNLQQNAQRARLDDAAAFKEELQRAIFDDERELFDTSLEFKRLMDSEQREFMQELSNISLDAALELGKYEAKSASELGKWQGIGGMVSGAAQIFAKTGKK